ncbi:unnamed protein product, partial [Laminaria digitata]
AAPRRRLVVRGPHHGFRPVVQRPHHEPVAYFMPWYIHVDCRPPPRSVTLFILLYKSCLSLATTLPRSERLLLTNAMMKPGTIGSGKCVNVSAPIVNVSSTVHITAATA